MIDLLDAFELEIIGWSVVAIVSLICIWTGYVRGETAWASKFSFKVNKEDGSRTRVSGKWGELISVVIWWGGVSLITYHCADSRMVDFGMRSWFATAVIGFIVLVLVWQHPIRVVTSETRMNDRLKAQLVRGYVYYRFFGFAVMLGTGVVFVKIVGQISVERAHFDVTSELLLQKQAAVTAALSNGVDLPGIVSVEKIYSEYKSLTRSIIWQLEPLAYFVCYVMIVTLLVSQTKMRHSFHSNARRLGYIVPGVSVFAVMALAGYVYYFQYSSFSRDVLANLRLLMDYSFDDFSYVVRVAEMQNEILSLSGFSGFLSAFGNEGGFFIVGLALIQFGASKLPKWASETLQ